MAVSARYLSAFPLFESRLPDSYRFDHLNAEWRFSQTSRVLLSSAVAEAIGEAFEKRAKMISVFSCLLESIRSTRKPGTARHIGRDSMAIYLFIADCSRRRRRAITSSKLQVRAQSQPCEGGTAKLCASRTARHAGGNSKNKTKRNSFKLATSFYGVTLRLICNAALLDHEARTL